MPPGDPPDESLDELPDEPLVGGYDVVYSRAVDPNRIGSETFRLPRQHRRDWRDALESLLKDPTVANPKVADASRFPLYFRDEHVMFWKQLVIVYHFLDERVIEIFSVFVQPTLPSDDDEDF